MIFWKSEKDSRNVSPLIYEPMVGREGHRGGTWVVLDFGCVVVHVFTEETRAFYDLERLWQDGKQVSMISLLNEG